MVCGTVGKKVVAAWGFGGGAGCGGDWDGMGGGRYLLFVGWLRRRGRYLCGVIPSSGECGSSSG